MDILIWLVMGGIIGWLASLIMKTSGQQGIIMNVVVGILGAVIGGWIFGPMLGSGQLGQGFSITSLFVALMGAIILLAIVSLFTRGRTRNINKL
ncbi:MAG: GlsB/YeaQ/YmgE family stress response membrane protein [Natronospirillum sp.]|uniref:GlsB/YeaQ/YmgE family stress response membrane protein n=1 Tax=Natronospirillum sp. TaxID=2812955 RepID=UPI0025DE0268|nr:GlsB/YeaQ/YmgE family stress response membrane protein [Natronospirillum sp.]MCH8550848.1 GlsB/YeaQ/YmgE family stress response membrane protein [Natronospirillum sp.]